MYDLIRRRVLWLQCGGLWAGNVGYG